MTKDSKLVINIPEQIKVPPLVSALTTRPEPKSEYKKKEEGKKMYTDYISGFGECFICSKEEITALKDNILLDCNAEYGGQLVQCYVHKELDINYAYITDIEYPTTD